MLFILILISLPYISTKINPRFSEDDLSDVKSGTVIRITGDPLWVLNLGNEEWLDAKLKLGTFAQEEDFYIACPQGSQRTNANILQSFPRIKKDDPANPKKLPQTTSSTPYIKDVKGDIMKMINKFALYTSIEPDVYVTENIDENNPSIVLYFKGSASCMVVKQENKEWHYVIKTMMFPAWFYERHDTFEAPISIPNQVKNTFFTSLLRFLRLVLSYPI